MSVHASASLSHHLIQSSLDAQMADHYLALLAQRIVLLEQQVMRSTAGSARGTGNTDRTALRLRLGKPTDFIATEVYPYASQVVDEQAQQLLQQFMLQSADQTLAHAYLASLGQHLDGLEQQCQPRTQATSAGLTTFTPEDLPSYAMLCALLPACFSGFWAGVSPRELSEHSQQQRSHDDGLINVYPPTPEQRAEAKALLKTFTPAQHTAVAGLCQTLQRVYRLTWQRDFKPLVLGNIL